MRKLYCALVAFIFVASIGLGSIFAQESTPTPVNETKIAEDMAKAAKAVNEPQKLKAEPKGKWNHESELGVALAGGNTDSKTVNFKQMTAYTWTKNLLRLDALFLYSFSDGTKSAQKWMGGIRYERALKDWISLFLGHNWEGDVFSGYDYRINNDIGAKFFFIQGDKKNNYLFNETGYRFSHENRIAGITPSSINIHFVRIYFEGAKSLTDILFAKLWTEFLPDLTDKKNVQINFESSLGVILSKYFSLKLAFLGKYDNEPVLASPALKKFDYLYTTSLVAKF